MRVGITGASGFIGRYLIRRLTGGGHEAVAFSRSPERAVAGCVETRGFGGEGAVDVGGLDAMVTLAGESILGLWTQAKKRRVLESRVQGTRRVVEAMKVGGPRVLISGSAIGYYGDTGDSEATEESKAGTGFLADVARQWEAEALAAEQFGTRVARVRIGFAAGRDGGPMVMIRRLFGLGLGGKLGGGRQWMSLVHVDDVAGLIVFLLERDAASGAFNAVCPEPVRNAEFTEAVARIMRRPAFLPAPRILMKMGLGELSHLLLDSLRVRPRGTLEAGYAFRFPNVNAILEDVLASR